MAEFPFMPNPQVGADPSVGQQPQMPFMPMPSNPANSGGVTPQSANQMLSDPRMMAPGGQGAMSDMDQRMMAPGHETYMGAPGGQGAMSDMDQRMRIIMSILGQGNMAMPGMGAANAGRALSPPGAIPGAGSGMGQQTMPQPKGIFGGQ